MAVQMMLIGTAERATDVFPAPHNTSGAEAPFEHGPKVHNDESAHTCTQTHPSRPHTRLARSAVQCSAAHRMPRICTCFQKVHKNEALALKSGMRIALMPIGDELDSVRVYVCVHHADLDRFCLDLSSFSPLSVQNS